jgi:hypothetical protein
MPDIGMSAQASSIGCQPVTELLCRRGGIGGPNANQDKRGPDANLIDIKECRLHPGQNQSGTTNIRGPS